MTGVRLPDPVYRFGIRRLLGRRLAKERKRSLDLDLLRAGPIAVATDDANRQHYEIPSEFYDLVLGPRRKYSSGLYPTTSTTLAEAEEAMLAETCRNAGLEDGMTVLDMGCGWGSLSLHIAEHFPNCEIMAVSNSSSQREHIERRGVDAIRAVTADINGFRADRRFDRIMSIEMFEHMRNWQELLARVGSWLEPDGRLFIHIFCHRSSPYLFEARSSADWMARYFFTGGLMPSYDLPGHFAEVEQRWRYAGTHYERTANDWLANLDRNRDYVLDIFDDVYGTAEASHWVQRWRLFFMAVAELFGWDDGQEWFVGHYRLRP